MKYFKSRGEKNTKLLHPGYFKPVNITQILFSNCFQCCRYNYKIYNLVESLNSVKRVFKLEFDFAKA